MTREPTGPRTTGTRLRGQIQPWSQAARAAA